MTLENIIKMLHEKTADFDATNYNGFLAIQVTLKDLYQDLYVEIKNGILSIAPYEYIDRQACITLSSINFIKLINKKLNLVTAVTNGQLNVEGDGKKALELAKLLA